MVGFAERGRAKRSTLDSFSPLEVPVTPDLLEVPVTPDLCAFFNNPVENSVGKRKVH